MRWKCRLAMLAALAFAGTACSGAGAQGDRRGVGEKDAVVGEKAAGSGKADGSGDSKVLLGAGKFEGEALKGIYDDKIEGVLVKDSSYVKADGTVVKERTYVKADGTEVKELTLEKPDGTTERVVKRR